MHTLRTIRRSLFTGFALMLLFAPGGARAQVAVNTCGQELSKPGVYELTANLDCSGTLQNGVTITASNVLFHLASHTLSSADCDTSKDINGIFVGGAITGVRIDGGRVAGFNDGIVLSSLYSTVRGMTVEKTCAFGIALEGHHNTIRGNIIQNNLFEGIGMQQAVLSTISDNYIADNHVVGMDISNGCTDNVVRDNILARNGVIGNQGAGVAVRGGDRNQISSNTFVGNFVGVQLNQPGSIVLRNIISKSINAGVWITSYGNSSTVEHNIVFGSGLADMLDETPKCGANLWVLNNFQTDLVNGVSDGGPGAGCI